MAFNVNAFRSQLTGDGARPNLFDVQLTGGGFDGGDLRFSCKSSQLPGMTMGIASVQYFGREIKLPGNRTYADWTVTVLNDENFTIREAFERWSTKLNSVQNNIRSLVSPDTYSAKGLVTQYGKDGSTLRTYDIIGAFPTDISAIDLDWGTNDTVEEYTVTLAYQWFETTGILI